MDKDKNNETIDNRVDNGILERIRSSVISKIAVCSLAGALSAGLGYGCGSEAETETSYFEPCYIPSVSSDTDRTRSSIQQTADSGYIFTRYANPEDAEDNTILISKQDKNGNQEWEQTFDEVDSDANTIQRTPGGGYIVASYIKSEATGKDDFLVLKTGSDGNKEWNKNFGESNHGETWQLQQTADGTIVAVGIYSKLLKLDSGGNLESE